MKKVLVTLAILAVMICGCGKVEEKPVVNPQATDVKEAPKAEEKKAEPKAEEKKAEPVKAEEPKVKEEPKAEK